MRKRDHLDGPPGSLGLDAALDLLDADTLRAFLREALAALDDRTRTRFARRLVELARKVAQPSEAVAPSDAAIRDAIAFAERAREHGYAEPNDVEDHLAVAGEAFLARRYKAAADIFGALLAPLGDGELDVGQDEMADEVLTVDSECAARYMVAVYLTTPADERVAAVRAALAVVDGVASPWRPIGDLEGAAVEPLPGFDGFLRRWRDRLEADVAAQRPSEWDTNVQRWLREVVVRLDGTAGLAGLARTSGSAHDLEAWCAALVSVRDWKAALVAFDEAAPRVEPQSYHRGAFSRAAATLAGSDGLRGGPAATRVDVDTTSTRLGSWRPASNATPIQTPRAGWPPCECSTAAIRRFARSSTASLARRLADLDRQRTPC